MSRKCTRSRTNPLWLQHQHRHCFTFTISIIINIAFTITLTITINPPRSPMESPLTDVEARVLGSMMEKELSTPEYYPLTLNALKAACNQKSSRNPVMALSEDDIIGAIDSLRGRHLAWQHREEGARVPKYSHNFTAHAGLQLQEVALLAVLLLRGPQTPGEIRSRVGRMCTFRSLDEVEETLRTVNEREHGPYVVELPRQPGRKEARYMHLLCGEPDPELLEQPASAPAAAQSGTVASRVDELEGRVSTLESRLEELTGQVEAFRKQFE